MPKPLPTPDRLFDRTWRPGHPFRPRVSTVRRIGMAIVFLLLCLVICGYWYITDANRVKDMAQTYLSTLLGGHVTVGKATLSIFEGLRLDDVWLYVDKDTRSRDSALFSADSFLIEYNTRALLSGKLEATKIMAIEPRVRLTENVDTGEWNYSRLLKGHSAASMPSAMPNKPIELPEIVLRNAYLDYSRRRNGVLVESSSLGIEGHLSPMPQTKVYHFEFQSRGKSDEIGPIISGQIVMGTGQITASLQNFEFGPDVKTMLPPDVRKWWEDHELTGQLNIPLLNYSPPAFEGGKPGYHVEIDLNGVTLAVHPEEWMGTQEHRTLRDLHQAMSVLKMAGLNRHAYVDHLAELVEPAPISLKQVHGRFTFSDDETINIDDLNGWLEEVPFKINGWIKGYTPLATAKLNISSSQLHDIEIPAAPRYLNSLPPALREIYDRFKPHGVCRFAVDLNRLTPGARPHVTGEIEIVDGNFTFDRFPYPLRNTSGKIIVTEDPASGEQKLELKNIRGRGVQGGPNDNCFVDINGTMQPLGPETQVDVLVKAENITSEPPLMAAFPPMTRKALTLFDAPGKGEFPKFSGDFQCNIHRDYGLESHWNVETDIHLDDASGSLVAFPYFMSGVSGDLKIFDTYIQMIGIKMKKGDATLSIDGKVSWRDPDAPPPPPDQHDDTPNLKPDLKIIAHNVPIDQDLLNALPASRRTWLAKVGAGGEIDLDGTIKPAVHAGDDVDIDLDVALHDGTLWPTNGKPTVTGVTGNLHLTNQKLTLGDLRGKRGDTDLTARGEIAWPTEPPTVVIQADAKNLTLDSSLYQILPAAAQAAWDQVKPQGTLDASLNYSGQVATTQPSGYEVHLTPRNLTATPQAVPYRLEQVAGDVTVLPDKILLKNMTAHHGDAKVHFDGAGTTGPQQAWDFTLGISDALIDDDLKKAVPPSLSDLLKSLQMNGKVAVEFNKLHVVQVANQSTPDADFDLKVTTDGSNLDVGVPLSNVKGAAVMAGTTRNGKLAALAGRMDIDSLTLAGRSVTKLSAELAKQPDQDQLTIGKLEARIAKGSMAGQIDYAFPDNNPSMYAINLVLHNADVRELAGQNEPNVQGQLSASLALEGTYNQPDSRRGRGDVQVDGQQLYKIPLVLGLLQITNLSLPITSPFTQASARYSIDGNRVTFEQIDLRSKEMLMQGEGNLDFYTKQVKMQFVTDSTTWLKLPIISDVIQGASHELLQIHVRGTLEEPKVSTGLMNTLTTTVDDVFRVNQAPTTQLYRKKPGK